MSSETTSTYRHFVDFEKWCPSCKHADLDETKDPCNDCLAHPDNVDSRKPVRWAASSSS